MPAPVRRMAPANAAQRAVSAPSTPAPVARPQQPVRRAAPSPVRETREAGKGFVATKVSDRAGTYYENEREVQLMTETFTEADPPAYVKVGAGMTISLGNFESLRIDCSITMPCKRGAIDVAYEIASDFVAARMQEEEINWQGTANKTVGKGR